MTRELYPAIEPYRQFFLEVGDGHRLYVEECGNPAGKPVVVLHGGPGGATYPDLRRFFDPIAYRIILFDQRGGGFSTPAASIESNTTWHLVADMEQLRQHLQIERWLVFGGSWGSTLALAYAERHPDRVTGLVLRGIFLLRKLEIDWFYQFGAHHLYPDAWETYLAPIPAAEQDDLISAYHRRLNSDEPAVCIEAARAWSAWEYATSRLVPKEESRTDAEMLAFARIENHYFINHGFFGTDQQLLDQVDRIRHIPAVIIQGRYDIVCPMISAWDLHRAWPEAEFTIIPDAGHAALETGTAEALVNATDKFRSNI